MKTFVVTLLLILLAPTSVWACEPTADEMRAFYSKWRLADEANAKTAIEAADSIFVGVVDKVELKEANGFLQIAHVTVESTLKGSPANYQTFRFDRDPGPKPRLETVSCSYIPDFSDPMVTETYPYLFYVRNGILIRANPLPLGEAPLPVATEIELVKRLVTAGPAR